MGTRNELVIGVTTGPDAGLCAAVSGAGGLGVLDLGAGDHRTRDALAQLPTGVSFGVRVPAGCALTVDEVLGLLGERAARLEVVLLGAGTPWSVADIPNRHFVLAEVTSLGEALETGADGVVACGDDGSLSTFVLLQQLLGAAELGVPVWARGGIGPRTAAASVVGGAAGVVLVEELTGLPESSASADGFLAPRLAARYGSVPRLVRAVRSAVEEAVRADLRPVLGAGSLLATALGVGLPVAQGPMTRVSDQPAFAEAVAREGGLPFLALALASGETTRDMMSRTREVLGDRPWGVGVLGFADDAVRAAQLEVIRELRPPAAIISGGLPDQAASLEALGVAAFLHVPSPDLLSGFLAAGARRFVFEGSECGGHVGPQASFPLWEAQIAVLEEFLDSVSDGVQVLFAGGVHDERSAAMVAAMAEPLARRGVGVGVLMGTSYLFTAEAVACGAVLPEFQRQVVSATATELLETAPGHVTRCVPSPYTAEFRAVAAGLSDSREAWAELERLNAGRLRVASKGLRRTGSALEAVSVEEQMASGLFMAGQVAVLRSSVTTVASLHASVTSGAESFRVARAGRVRHELGLTDRPQRRGGPVDVAVVGMACVFPGAPDLETFWANVVGGMDSVGEVPERRWDTATYFGEGADRTPSKWGGFLPEVPFDPLKYGIPPASLAAIEPVQLLALEVAQRALADAGYGSGGFDRSRASVVFGAEAGSDLSNATTLRMVLPSYVDGVPPELADQLPALTEDSFPGRLANVIAGRIANRLDLGGANFTVDAACASSLAAVDVACKELVSGSSDLVLAGGADLHNAIDDYLLFASVGALSPTGRCRTFDASADGIALGEGVACVVLKRLADAERDGDRVYAVIRGVGSASDGRALGLTAPRADGQRRALERAYASAGISPSSVGLVEAHGTGTVVGDRTELATLTEVFTEAGAAPGSCALGSVKSQIGHTKCAAGLAGLIKSALAVWAGVRPPTLFVESPNPAWAVDRSPFAFHRVASPWLEPAASRVAGVSAFGFGGTNFHVVLGGHPSAATVRHGLTRWPAELFLFASERDVARVLALAETGAWSLRDLAFTALSPGPVAVAVVASSVAELVEMLRAALDGRAVEGVYRGGVGGKLAVLFPGQGSQRPGMLSELFVAFPELQRFARMAPPSVFPPALFSPGDVRDAAARVRDTRVAQPALGAVGLAAHELLRRLGVEADMFGGHSYGELVALAAAGALDAATLLELSAARASAVVAAAGEDPGGMAAVTASVAAVEEVLSSAGVDVVVANHNAPRQVVVSGRDVDGALAALRAAGIAGKRIPVACAFHSPVVAAAGSAFAEVLAGCRIGQPDRPVWTNRGAVPYGSDVRRELAAQIGAPVRFVEQVRAMYDAGARVFVEAGPGTVLSGLVREILADQPHTVVALEERPGLAGLLHALARLAVAGVPVRAEWLFAGRGARDVSALPVPRTPGWLVDGQTVRTADGTVVPGGLAPPRRVALAPAFTPTVPDREALIEDFLRTSREFVAVQRDVMLSYLGAPVAPPAAAPQPPIPAPALPTQTTPTTPTPAPASSGTDILTTVVEVIARRTGYPTDLIDPGLDLEADLSIDSIKRTEIATELTGHLDARDRLTSVVKSRTAAAMAEALTPSHQPTGQLPTDLELTGHLPTADADAEKLTGRLPAQGPLVASPGRYEFVPVPVPAEAAMTALVGVHVVVAGGPADLAEEVAGQLSARGAVAVVVSGRRRLDALEQVSGPGQVSGLDPTNGFYQVDGLDRVDGLISLHAYEDEPVLPTTFDLFRSVLGRAGRILAITPGRTHDGLRGFFRSLHREHPDTTCRLVELPPTADLDTIARTAAEEAAIPRDEPVIIAGDTRHTLHLTRRDRVGARAADGPVVERDAVVLLIGGARGITAEVAKALDCHLVLAGRTAPDTAASTADELPGDLHGLRAHFARHNVPPQHIDREARRVLATREVAATLAHLGTRATYHQLDVRDTAALRRLVKEVHAEHGRLDGVVYAAGVIEDRLAVDKDPDSFARVHATKVEGAKALLEELHDLPTPPRFTVFFGSISAATGNRGQTDYAAANDALEALADNHALTVHWGPWSPDTGMVTEELARAYAERGIAVIDPGAGVAALLDELRDGTRGAVVLTASEWS
ncbi:type I polyketide synthase [Saccharothrix variisporea]|uniref:Acyl transferase domain-containing protein n=1 Tax=Saccharothrix variisporea TaxID=543527 RepID=A0A495XMK2_9PSEU|nr:type I polyketide synthase [Saccharothrix variisporea]RKT73683.1 acyl transferase domain-containing protein [Saccharothrix variisporea]